MSRIKKITQNGILCYGEFAESLEANILDDPGLRGALRGLNHSIAREVSKHSRPSYSVKKGVAKSNTLIRK